MPDRYICDCGFSSPDFTETCPECGSLIMAIDGETDDIESLHGPEKYSEEAEDGDTEEVPSMPQRKAA